MNHVLGLLLFYSTIIQIEYNLYLDLSHKEGHMGGAAIFMVRRLYLVKVLNGNPILTQFFFLFNCFYLKISLQTGLIIIQALEVVQIGGRY